VETKEIHIAANKKAAFLYQVVQAAEAGLQLTGTEIKSVRGKQVSISEAHCFFMRGELWIRGMHIAPYKEGGRYNHDPDRDRKLLLHKGELRKLHSRVREKGMTIVPLRLFISPRGFAKLEIGLAKGKRQFDKRAGVKKREAARELKRVEKEIRNR
jgi:SsrA-binding protein